MSETTAIEKSNGAPLQVSPTGEIARPQYAEGFDGMATEPFDKETRAILLAPIDPEDVEIKPDGICYLPGVFYRQRLTAAFGPGGWAMAPRSPAKRAPAQGGECVMYHGALIALGRYVSEAVGQCVYYPNNAGMQYADAFEGAKTDAITRCCKDLFIASELWDPTWRAQWQAKYAQQVTKRAQVWDPTTRKKEWGEKVVWERKSRAQKLGNVSTPPRSAGTAPSAPTAAPGPSVTAAPALPPMAPPADTGEAPADDSLNDLRGLLTELKWKKKQTHDWFDVRFGVQPPELTADQLRTAFRLLYALGNPEKYAAILRDESAAGRCKP